MTPRPSNISIASKKDENEIFDLLCLLHKENAMAEMDEEKVWDKIKTTLHRPENIKNGVIGVIKNEGKIEAISALIPSQWWYSQRWFLEDICNFVHPSFRRSNHAKDLLNFDKWCSEQLGMPLLIGILSTIRTEPKVRLFSRQLQPVGALFIYDPNKETPLNKEIT